MKSSTNLDKESIVKEVTDRFTQLIATINQKDAGAWEKHYSKDDFVSAIAGGESFATRNNWVQTITSHFSMRDRQHLELHEVHVIPLAPNVALLTSQESVDMQIKNGQATQSRHIFTMIWKKEPEGWQIVHSHESWVDELVK
jgi:ketosteroid isomerase-like protein